MSLDYLLAANLFNIKDRVAVVTGAGTGIGFLIAEALIVNGAFVYLTGRRADTLAQAVAKLDKIKPGRAIAVPTDVTSKESLENLVNVVSKDHDAVDILVPNAGTLLNNPVKATPGLSLEELHKALSSSSEEIWDETLKTNVSSVYFTVAAFVPLLGAAAKRGGGRGSVIITGSSAGFHWDRGFDSLAYQTSKAGVHHLTTTLAAKLIPHGIRVNAIAPGIFPSQLIDPTDPNNPFVKAIQTVPLKRFGKDTDLAGIVLFLGSEAGSFIVGRVIPLEGGRILTAHA